jgi:hypothetical protein
MDEGQNQAVPQPTVAFDHPAVGALKEQSSDDKSGYQEQDEYATSEAPNDAGARGEALPPRGTEMPREPLATRSRGK